MSVKRSVSVAIHDGDRVLIVQRPADDEDLPNAWGLPAASLQSDESWGDAVLRAGREKLGVELSVGRELHRGKLARRDYELEMRLYEAGIASGDVNVPQEISGVTQYQGWKWGSAEDLRPAAARGSLCCALYIRSSRPQ